MTSVVNTESRTETPFFFRGRRVRGLLFDMDGTLAETFRPHADSWIEWTRSQGIPMTLEEYRGRFFGRSNKAALLEIMPFLKDDPQRLERMADERENLFLAKVDAGRVHPVTGIPEMVGRAKARGLGLAIASSAPRENVERVVKAFGLAESFPVRLGMEDAPRAKPAPDLFLEAARRLGLSAAECVAFEDSRFGLEAARAAGCAVVAVETLHTAAELEGLADHVARDFAALLAHPDWCGL